LKAAPLSARRQCLEVHIVIGLAYDSPAFLAKQAVSTALVHCDGGIFTKWQLLLAALQALVQQKKAHLLGVAVKGAALLGVDEVVPVACGQHWFLSLRISSLITACMHSGSSSCSLMSISNPYSSTGAGVYSLLLSPLHDLVSDDERDAPVEDLVAGAAESVEDGGVEGTGQRVLTVLGEAVVDNALLGKGA
jgi:hypothetical protein